MASAERSLEYHSIKAMSIISIFILAAATLLRSETARPADAVADAIGVNTHFGDYSSSYIVHADLAVSLMRQMGVRHYRDGITYQGSGTAFPAQSLALFNQLGLSGIRGDYILNCVGDPGQNSTILHRLNNVEAVEYPNESDVSGDGNWATHLKACGATISQIVPQTSAPLVGPSLVRMNSAGKLGPVPMTVNNLHAYFNNYPPDLNYPIGSAQTANAGGGPCMKNEAGEWDCFPGLLFDVDNVKADGPGKPVWITETGYVTSGQPSSPGHGQYVPPEYGPAYLTRMILWALKNGVPRVYFYALLDDPGAAYGLLSADMQPKPSFHALTSLIHLMDDPKSAEMAPATLEFSLSGGDRFLMHSLFQKSDGTFYLVLWLAASDWDGAREITPSEQRVSVNIPGHTILTEELMQRSGYFLPAAVNNDAVNVNVGTSPIFLRIH